MKPNTIVGPLLFVVPPSGGMRSRHRLKAELLICGQLLAMIGVVVVGLTGCERATAEKPLAVTPPAATYRAGHGLQLTPLAREFVGLTVAEFKEQLPADALLRTVQGDFVYVQNGEWLLRTPVKLGPRDPAAPAIPLAEGLYEGDRIVTRGVRALWLAELHFLRAGQACTHAGG